MTGLLFVVTGFDAFVATRLDYPWWWNAAGILVAMVFGVIAVAGGRIPLPILRSLWASTPVVTLLLLGSWAFVYRGVPDDVTGIWVWRFELIVVCFVVLVAQPWLAIATSLVSGLLPSISSLLAFGHVPTVIAGQSALHAGNVAFVVIILGTRQRLSEVAAAADAARQHQRSEVVARATAERRAEFVRKVHDDILATLAAALTFRGAPPPELKREASHALTVVDRATPRGRSDSIAIDEAIEILTSALNDADPGIPISVVTEPGTLDSAVVESITSAAGEAVRNAARHARARRWVEIEARPGGLSVVVSDAGQGFDPANVPPHRLGVRESILARMDALPGGACVLDSGSTGTVVRMTWRK